MAFDESVAKIHLNKLIKALNTIHSSLDILQTEDIESLRYLLAVQDRPLATEETKQKARQLKESSHQKYSTKHKEISEALSDITGKIENFTKDAESFNFYKQQCVSNGQLKNLLGKFRGGSASSSSSSTTRTGSTSRPTSGGASRPTSGSTTRTTSGGTSRPTSGGATRTTSGSTTRTNSGGYSRPTSGGSTRPTSGGTHTGTRKKSGGRRFIIFLLVIGAFWFGYKLTKEKNYVKNIKEEELFQGNDYEQQIAVLDSIILESSKRQAKKLQEFRDERESIWMEEMISDLRDAFSTQSSESQVQTAAKYKTKDSLRYIDKLITKAEEKMKDSPENEEIQEYRKTFNKLIKRYRIKL